ncbi:hypothetical protein BZG36_03630 [Bifiguratus adelaidae]|uniref:Cyclin-like domain-containing protein n=1 Tax=Bifiguratus adelaidae TaxID=1938954 RepID=A0A261Y054_9FUNG|nr:hypothetical protein BZG36_03630 [Bifiguratus adelaidae]
MVTRTRSEQEDIRSASPTLIGVSGPAHATQSAHRRYVPYITKNQQLALKMSVHDSVSIAKEVTLKVSSCRFIEAVGKRAGFPQRTVSTAQALFHRFYLHYAYRDYPTSETCIATLFVASKIEDTSKKLKDIIVAGHAIRHPDAKELDPEQISEERRKRLIGIERLLLEMICFDFQTHHPYPFIPKFVKALGGSKELAFDAYLIAKDAYRLPLCLQYPVHTIAAASIYLASRFRAKDPGEKEVINSDTRLGRKYWYQAFYSRIEDIEDGTVCLSNSADICHDILELLIQTEQEADGAKYTQMKITLNEEAKKRQKERSAPPPEPESSYVQADLEVLNSNQYTILFDFAKGHEL